MSAKQRIRLIVTGLIAGLLVTQVETGARSPDRYIGPKPACLEHVRSPTDPIGPVTAALPPGCTVHYRRGSP
jgi:hypothetical protein